MLFTLVVMQPNGEITDRRAYTHAKVRTAGGWPNFADGCHYLLKEMIPPILRERANFQIPIDPDERVELAWR